MQTVTGRINEIKQPSGGYVKPRSLLRIKYDDGKTLNDIESKQIYENINMSVWQTI